jgi:hypothetical protein
MGYRSDHRLSVAVRQFKAKRLCRGWRQRTLRFGGAEDIDRSGWLPKVSMEARTSSGQAAGRGGRFLELCHALLNMVHLGAVGELSVEV